MAHILRFAIEGLAGRAELYEKELNRDINVFFGLNGSGKTSLLKILNAAMANDGAALELVPFKRATVEIYSVTYRRTFIRKVVQTVHSDNVEVATGDSGLKMRVVMGKVVVSKEPEWTTSPKSPATRGFQHTYLPTQRLYWGAEGSSARRLSAAGRDGAMTERALDEMFAETIGQLWLGYSNGMLSAVRAAQSKGLAAILRSVVTSPKPGRKKKSIDGASAYKRMTQFLKRQGATVAIGPEADFVRHLARQPILKSVVAEIDSIESDIERALAPRTQLEEVINSLYSGGKHVVFTDSAIEVRDDAEKAIPVATLSSGEKQVMAMLIESARADENTMIVDEPELSMHIEWQAKLIDAMRAMNAQAQFIMATHSPELLGSLPDKAIFRL